ncbi:MAG: class I SAM-dependent methyltransferase [Methanobacteriaceae archaeon]|jgi:SAM-dependent methyltransferase
MPGLFRKCIKGCQKNYQITDNTGKFIVGDVRNLPIKTNTYDVVLSTGLLEHFENPRIVINEMTRILKPNGVFYSDIVPDKFSLFRFHLMILNKLNLWKGDDLYEIKLNKEDINNWLQLEGLHDINVFPAGVFLPQLPFSRKIPFLKKIEYKIFFKLKPLLIIYG